ncbi:MAG: hypothetical protein IJT94_09980, partial [Oscillibacter sp.]|nr:hypothetical protein [Oscillibacter sp.]
KRRRGLPLRHRGTRVKRRGNASKNTESENSQRRCGSIWNGVEIRLTEDNYPAADLFPPQMKLRYEKNL